MHFYRLEANIDDERILKRNVTEEENNKGQFLWEIIKGALLEKICRNAISLQTSYSYNVNTPP
ncbi:TPA: hypothetical protein RG395_001679 [Legionella pneumophila]|nr:hypothetical protein [Legionella pneumophila]MDW8961863.1 hypothetical protein [Legionella pneumophila subsp. fraseri]HAT1660059.1 hypothetical protein [Legionella pneumophila]HAT1846783.1 hypothetical protein [Legionella pneumophila]HAT8123461.1 hypothetical protein [Legionella pneumophila]HAT8356654.1 hypothetical protein [Legionella pneumophila]